MTMQPSVSVGPTAMSHTHSLEAVGTEQHTDEQGNMTSYTVMFCSDPGCGYGELQ